MNELAKQVADLLNLTEVPNLYNWLGIAGVFLFVFITVINFFPTKKDNIQEEVEEKKKEDLKAVKETIDEQGERDSESLEKLDQVEEAEEVEEAEKVVHKPIKPQEPKISWTQRLVKGLSRTRQDVWGKIDGILKGSKLDDEQFEQIEEILYTSDLSPALVAELLDELKEYIKKDNESQSDSFPVFVKEFLRKRMIDIQAKENKDLYHFNAGSGETKVIMIVGVNGAGKTTTIGKLATKLKAQGANVVVGACDTFRAAAVEQLQAWCQRAGVDMIKAHDGADPSGVAYDTVAKAKEIKADYCIIDTAGRLHTASNLMDELAKTKKVMSKIIETAPHETLLVIDAITGQNAIRQAEEFHKSLDLTGLIFTKCDGSSKAGSAVSIVQKLQVPITYIGVGEDVEDLNVFDMDEYLDALLGLQA